MSQAFESSAAGAIGPDAVLECGVCWWTYDPDIGDETRDIPPGVAFTDLAENWRCPACDAEKSKFMVVNAGARGRVAGDRSLEARLADLTAAYDRADASMTGLPVHNDRLAVEMVGFREHEEGFVGVVVTPWCMNLTVIPSDPDAPPPGALGSSRSIAFPSGSYSFIAGRLDGFGLVESCSLFSPMDEFQDVETVRAAAEAAMEGLYDAPEPKPAKEKAVSRRFVLTLNGAQS
ncbi:MAG: [NiFe]-hydrogenase assembly chaperone HybE [Pseudomonadota bacterium]